MKIKYALCGMLAMLPVICCAQAMTEQQKNFHEKVINPIKREISVKRVNLLTLKNE